jgi:hypothetical protein
MNEFFVSSFALHVLPIHPPFCINPNHICMKNDYTMIHVVKFIVVCLSLNLNILCIWKLLLPLLFY